MAYELDYVGDGKWTCTIGTKVTTFDSNAYSNSTEAYQALKDFSANCDIEGGTMKFIPYKKIMLNKKSNIEGEAEITNAQLDKRLKVMQRNSNITLVITILGFIGVIGVLDLMKRVKKVL